MHALPDSCLGLHPDSLTGRGRQNVTLFRRNTLQKRDREPIFDWKRRSLILARELLSQRLERQPARVRPESEQQRTFETRMAFCEEVERCSLAGKRMATFGRK